MRGRNRRNSEYRTMWEDRAIDAAIEARQRAYAPYSRFRVGAALVAGEHLVAGMNLENRSFGGTICAERVAACAAWTSGWVPEQHPWQLLAIAADEDIMPCGICLQFLSEFAPELPLVLVNTESNEVRRRTLRQLLPERFVGQQLPRTNPKTDS